MLLMWSIGSVLFFDYGLIQKIPVTLIFEPIMFVFFCNICWSQCIQYDDNMMNVLHSLGIRSRACIWLGAFMYISLTLTIIQYTVYVVLQVG